MKGQRMHGVDIDAIHKATVKAHDGMTRALKHADKTNPNWSALALRFLERYARNNEYFISEDVSALSAMWGMSQPPTLRAWGAVYKAAAKNGWITIDGIGRSRLRHWSICPRWKSLIFKEQKS